MKARVAAAEQMEIKAITAERELETVKNQNKVLSGQAKVLQSEKIKLEEDLGKARKKILERNCQLKAAQKQSSKDNKLLLQAKDRSFSFGYDEAVLRPTAWVLTINFSLRRG